MTDDVEYGPDPNDVRRHAKKMCTELEYRKRYMRLNYYKPNPKQLEFHNLVAPERMLRGANQSGKTTAGAAAITMDILARYPDWYRGRKFLTPPPIERPYDFLAWCASSTSTTTRDGAQVRLLGDIREDGGLGTGLLPLDSLSRPTMARGISDFVDSIGVRRDSGGRAVIRFKTYEMDRKAFQGEAVDEVWADEDPGYDDTLYGEILARLVSTRGQVLFTATPILGVTPICKRFKEKLPGTAEVLMTLDDATHIPPEDRAMIAARYKENERATRVYGADMQGEGAVFEIAEEQIKHDRDPATFPPYWRWLWGLDFSHAGLSASAHAFAAVLGARHHLHRARAAHAPGAAD